MLAEQECVGARGAWLVVRDGERGGGRALLLAGTQLVPSNPRGGREGETH